MYFKQLELTGFKSFADRTVLRLDPGITAVVGPNGCGKSNILDSLRWVLGEQSSKALRGSHMQDVIFNGSENRHALGMAEVSVTFDNADSKLPVDFAEVQVTRRLYRSGESEYLINKASCRLKDVLELFMDTGIGTQAYSMIGQGKMDMILSQKPEDRRFLFEEAAGIIKYKNRKKVAMRRLESAEQNLLRLMDIVAEIERQMRTLKRQVNAAIRYRELTEQLRDIEIRAAWIKYDRLSQRVAELRELFAKAQDLYEQVSAKVTSLEARHEELDLSRLETDRALASRRERVYEIDREMEKLERQVGLLQQQTEFSRNQQRQAGEEREAFHGRAAAIREQIARTQAETEALRTELEACESAIGEKAQFHAETAGRAAEAEEQVERLRTDAVERMNARARMQTELETIGVRIHNVDTQLASIQEQQGAEDERRAGVEGRLDEARREESEKHAALEIVEKDKASATAEHAAQTQALRDLNERWQTCRERKSSLEARLTSLRELRDNYEGFAVGVRAVMRAKNENMAGMEGIIGPAGDLLSTEKTYEQAIEAALGGNINNVIVKDSAAAKSAINFLKKHNAGRVTFLPLDIIRGGAGDQGQALRKRPGVIGPAIEHVRFEPHIKSAVEYLLHSTLIVETLDHAIEIARTERNYPRLVTLEGEVVSSSGAVTGGRAKNESRGLLGRSAEITELGEKTEALQKEIKSIAERGEAVTKAIQEAQRLARELEQQESALHKELGQLGVVIARQTTELDNLSESTAALAGRREALAEQRRQLEGQKREVEERTQSLENDDETLKEHMAQAQSALSAVREAANAVASELGNLRVQQASLNQRMEELLRDAEREQRELEAAIRDAERRQEMLAQHAGQEETLEEEIQSTLERAGELSENREQAQALVNESENARQEVLDELESIDGELRSLREQQRSGQVDVHRFELELRSDEDKIGFFEERILTEYHIALAQLSAEQVGEDEYDEETRERLVNDIRERLQRMGDVNLMAIEEYEALEQRHGFLTGQADDLQKAREALLGVIARSDKRIREMFMETFEEVANHFREYFRILFNGGQARVYLVNEDDPLESGIEIEARPPGKKPTTISLLSGGESAMTAIALLFSILKSKPTPFCILDEVDAPLDDSNIGRFLNMVDDFSKETQFIVITHNKQTMSRANAMYGVTMQERGVSQLLSARMTEARESA